MQDHFEESYMGKLWYIVLGEDKRSFNEYFSEEYGITLNDDITDDQLNYLVVFFMLGYSGDPSIQTIKKLKQANLELLKEYGKMLNINTYKLCKKDLFEYIKEKLLNNNIKID